MAPAPLRGLTIRDFCAHQDGRSGRALNHNMGSGKVKSLNAKKAAPKTSKRLLSAMIVASLAAAGSAGAGEILTGNPDVVLRWDNTFRVNLATRVEGQDASLLASPNFDDGDRNFDKGMVSERIDVLSEFDFVYQDRMGFRISGAGWYDAAYENLDNENIRSTNHMVNGRAALGLSDETRHFFRGPSAELLDAFAFAKFNVGGVPVNVKAGPPYRVLGRSHAQPGAQPELRPVRARPGQAVLGPGHRNQGTVPAAPGHLDAGPGHADAVLRRSVLLRLGTGAHPRSRLLPRLQ